jgi:L-asparagine transporter-like permease
MNFFNYYLTKIYSNFTNIYSVIIVIGLSAIVILIILGIIQVFITKSYKKKGSKKHEG